MVEIKTHMDHYLFTTGLKQRPVRKVISHVPQGLFYSVTEISNNQVSSYIYQVPMPENQDKITAGFHQLLPMCKYWTDWKLLWKANFPHLQLGFWRSLGDLAHSSIKLPALWKVLELAKVSYGQVLKLWELGRQQGGRASQRQAGNSLMAVMREN